MDKKAKAKVKINNISYDVPVNIHRIAIWEHYIPYERKEGIFKDLDSIYNIKHTDFVDSDTKLGDITLSSKIRLESLYNNLDSLINYRSQENSNEFKIIECGCGICRTTRVLVYLLNKASFKNKSLIAFDTFEGLPASTHLPMPDLVGKFKTTQSYFDKLFEPYNFVNSIKGVLPHSLPKKENGKYDFIHLDLDLYEGTKGSLEYFFPRTKKRGIIQIDDYNNFPWIGVNNAVDEYLAKKKQSEYSFHTLPLGGAYIVKL